MNNFGSTQGEPRLDSEIRNTGKSGRKSGITVQTDSEGSS